MVYLDRLDSIVRMYLITHVSYYITHPSFTFWEFETFFILFGLFVWNGYLIALNAIVEIIVILMIRCVDL